MFASARTAAASPLVPPTLKRFANTHSPVMGLGIRASGSPSMSSSSTLVSTCASSSTMHTASGSGSGQPVMRLSALPRMRSSSIIIPPRTPRLQCTPTLPSAHSPLISTPSGAQLPNAEGYFTDDNASDIKEAFVSGSRSINTHSTQRRHFTPTTNVTRSALRNNPFNAHSEVERIGLGISGLSLNPFTPNTTLTGVNYSNDISTPVLNDSEPEEESEHSKKRISRRRRVTTTKPCKKSKSGGFHARAQIIGSPNLNVELDGYAADNEKEDSKGFQRRTRRRRTSPATSGPRSCKGRVLTVLCA